MLLFSALVVIKVVMNICQICIGHQGGALGIGVGDKILMLENSWYSVISPENCSTILWRSWDFKEKAADSLKLTAENMYNLNLSLIHI